MHTAHVSIKVVFESEACLTYITIKWSQAFVHCAKVSIEVDVLPKTYRANITYVWLQAFMNIADMCHQVAFLPKTLSTPFVLTLESTWTPRSRHGSK